MLSPLLRRYTEQFTALQRQDFIALCGTVALPWWLNDVKLTIPLTLGWWPGRLRIWTIARPVVCVIW